MTGRDFILTYLQSNPNILIRNSLSQNKIHIRKNRNLQNQNQNYQKHNNYFGDKFNLTKKQQNFDFISKYQSNQIMAFRSDYIKKCPSEHTSKSTIFMESPVPKRKYATAPARTRVLSALNLQNNINEEENLMRPDKLRSQSSIFNNKNKQKYTPSILNKHNIKISSSKLPKDFFLSQKQLNDEASQYKIANKKPLKSQYSSKSIKSILSKYREHDQKAQTNQVNKQRQQLINQKQIQQLVVNKQRQLLMIQKESIQFTFRKVSPNKSKKSLQNFQKQKQLIFPQMNRQKQSNFSKFTNCKIKTSKILKL